MKSVSQAVPGTTSRLSGGGSEPPTPSFAKKWDEADLRWAAERLSKTRPLTHGPRSYQWQAWFRKQQDAQRMQSLFGGYIQHCFHTVTGGEYWRWGLSNKKHIGIMIALLIPYIPRLRAAVWEASLGKA